MKGSRTRNARKYRNPAIVRGPICERIIFTNTNEDAHIKVARSASIIATTSLEPRLFIDIPY
jgi:hypothetical protein